MFYLCMYSTSNFLILVKEMLFSIKNLKNTNLVYMKISKNSHFTKPSEHTEGRRRHVGLALVF